MVFADRHDAGRQLAELLAPLAAERPVVIALPRGGVPVAAEIVRVLGAPLDVRMVRKLGAPQNPEFAIGAIAEDGTVIVDAATVRALRISDAELDRILARERAELSRRIREFRDGRAPLDVSGRTVILVDDGLATGLSDLAAVHALMAEGAARIIVAAPVGSREAVAALEAVADRVICCTVPPDFVGVGRWYRDFHQVDDAAVVAALASASGPHVTDAVIVERSIVVECGVRLAGDLRLAPGAIGLVIFAHGSGSSRRSPRNRMVANRLNASGIATLLIDLLAPGEEDRRDLVFDIPFLAGRLAAATRWARDDPDVATLPIGYFGASTGAGAALWAAADPANRVRAVVSRGGRPDLAQSRLSQVDAPTLLIVGGADHAVLELNRVAADALGGFHRIAVVPGAGHLFEEPGALEEVAELATEWFVAHFSGAEA
jgi:putative phosphoribosyl transferase